MKRILTLVLVLVLALCCITACKTNKPESELTPVSLTIKSLKEVSIEVGQAYTLTYETDGAVNVAVSGGTYDKDSQKFSATEPGTYTITVTATAEGKKDTVATVTVTVTAASADKTALITAITGASALKKGDYTSATWSALDTALKAANTARNQAGISQTDVDSAAAALTKAITDLQPVEIAKAVVAEDESSFTYNSTTYKAEDFNNFAAIVAEIRTLNAKTEIVLKSVYTTAIDAILATLDAKVKLVIKSDLRNNTTMLVETLGTYTLTAESEDDVTFAWTVNDEVKSSEATLEFTPAAFETEYVIKCTVTKGENTNVKTLKVSFREVDYKVNNIFASGITVEDNKVTVTGNYEWPTEEGRKVTLPDVRLSGNFTVHFDLTFTGGNGVMAMFLLKDNGENNSFWVAVLQHSNKLEVATAGHSDDFKPRYDMPVGTVDLNKVIHVMMTRTITDSKAYLYAYLLDDAGNVIMEHKANGLYKNDADSLGTVQLGIQAENCQFVVSNIAVGIEDSVISKTALNKALAVSSSYQEVDYTAESWAALASAKGAASAATTQEEIVAATESVSKATTDLVLAPVTKVVVSEGNISFGGKTYVAANFENMADIIAEIETLNADATITLNSVYAPKAQEIIAKLVSKVTLAIAGAPENGVQYLVNTLPSFAMTATASEDATVAWSVNGEAVSSEAAYTFAPKAFGSYTITCVATQGEYSTEKEYKFTLVNAGWTSNKPGGAVIDENNAIRVTGDYGWDDLKGKKVTTNDITLSGNFTIYFDLTFNNQSNVNVFAWFLNKSNGDVINDWVAITSQNNKLEVSCLEQKAYKDMTANATAIGTKTSYIVTREISDGRAYITATQIDANGNVVNDGTQDSGNRVSSDYTGPVVLGIQSENAHFVVENIRVNSAATINSKVALRALVKSTEDIIKTDYVEAVVKTLNEKIGAAQTVLDNVDATQAQIDEAFTNLETAIAAFKPENYTEVTKAQVTADAITYSITGITLNKNDLYNFDAIAAIINTLNGSDEYAANSVYTEALTEALESADYKIGLSTIDFKGLDSGESYVTSDKANYAIEVSSKTKNLTYAWTINGEPVEAQASYAFKPESGKTYTIKVVIQKTGEGYEDQKEEFLLENVTFMHSDVKTPMDDRVTVRDDGSFSSVTGIGWGDWEGRKVLYDDLVFNGSFSIAMDLTIDEKGGGANVATIHLLNADTLSPSFGGDWAYVGYGCICLHENPVRLESNWNGTGKKQSSDGGFEDVAAKMTEAASLLETGKSFTVKLTCYRKADGKLQLVYALLNGTEWIEFNRNEWAGDMKGGFIVGINIENVGITAKNVRYELLTATDDYIAGSVKSRAALSAALVQYKNLDVSQYVNPTEFIVARDAAWAAMADNSASADYDAATKALVEAAKALVGRDVAVSAGALDKGYANYRGVDKFTATFADDIEATEIKWTYKLNGEEKTAEGADLALEVGAYTDVVLSFKVGEETYSYTYQNFSVAAIGLKSNTDTVTLNEDGSVKVDNGAGWNQKDQLVIDGCRTQEFELVFNAKYDGNPGGEFRVMCINLFGEDIRPVFGYQREGRGDRAQLGFDSNGGQWNDINNTDAEGEPYDYIYGESGAKFSLKLTQDGEGKSTITFTVYAADGSVISTKSCDYSKWYSSTTDIRFTFENIDLTLSDFEVYYN